MTQTNSIQAVQVDQDAAPAASEERVAGLRAHPVCDLLPSMSEDEFASLREDIRAHGVRVPIVVHEERIIDGRQRWRACQELGLPDPPTVPWDENGSLVEFIAAANLRRRHLSVSQRAAIAIELLPHLEQEAKQRQRLHGGTAPGRTSNTQRQKTRSDHGKAAQFAASLVGVSTSSVERAKRLVAADPEAFQRVKSGEIKLGAAVRSSCTSARRPSRKSRKRVPAAFTTKNIADLAPGSVDLVVWADGDVGQLPRVTELSHRALRERGALVAILAPGDLCRVLRREDCALVFRWVVALTAHGPKAGRSGKRRERHRGWLAAVWFTKADASNRASIDLPSDVIAAGVEADGEALRPTEDGVRTLIRFGREGQADRSQGREPRVWMSGALRS